MLCSHTLQNVLMAAAAGVSAKDADRFSLGGLVEILFLFAVERNTGTKKKKKKEHAVRDVKEMKKWQEGGVWFIHGDRQVL